MVFKVQLLRLLFPNGTIYFGGASLVSGTANNGVWSASIPVSLGMPVGFANINVGIVDAVGNWRNYNFQDLQNLGFDFGFEIINTNIQDTIPPSLLGITINPTVVDVSDSSQIVSAVMSLSDDISGIQGTVTTTAVFPNGTTYFGGASLVSGTSNSGVWSASIPVSFGMPVGFANINVGIVDAVGNRRNYNFQDLQNLGFDSGFEIVNNKTKDTIPPILLAISINPKVVDVSDSSQVVSVVMSLSDDITGIQGTVTTTAVFPNGTTYFGGASLVSGTANNGVWEFLSCFLGYASWVRKY
ncbi:MAG: hypothetical protein IPN86_17510 [Saprospiraceae bacterium]|nr:hypothetical protein [Saprospiraceae bacterium]